MGWISENIMNFFADLGKSFVTVFGDQLNNVFFWIVEKAVNTAYIHNAERFVVTSALALVVLNVIRVVASGYLLETDYDPDADPFNLIVKIAEAVAVIVNAGWLFDWMLETARMYGTDFLGGTSAPGFGEHTNMLLDPVTVTNTGLAYALGLIALIVAFLIFTIVAGLRGAELIAMKLFMPYFALDLLSTSRERWNNFFMAYIIAFFSYAFQILFFMVAMQSYLSLSTDFKSDSYIQTCIWIIMAIRAPRFLEKFIYKSGVSNAASGGIRMVVQTAVMRGTMRI